MTTADGSPVSRATGKTIAEGRTADVGTQIIAGLPTDPEARRRVMAAQLFPNLPPLEAQSRVFYGDGGRLAAVDARGNPYYVDAAPPSLSGRTLGDPLRYVASGTGAAIPTVTGMAAGALAAPTSLVVGPLAAAGGAALGDQARQFAARQFDPAPPPIDLWQTSREAASAGVGQSVGGLAVRIAAPNRLGMSPLDINKLHAGRVLPEAERLNTLAASQGVDTLTPGMTSGLPSLLSHEDVIASGTTGPALADTAANQYGKLKVQLGGAYDRMLGGISPATDKTDAALMFQQGTEDAIRLVRQDANAAARPAYEAAERGGQVMSPDLAQLADVPAVQTALKEARAEYKNLYRVDPPDGPPDFNLWNLAKQKLDDMHGIAKKAGENTSAMSVDKLRGDLLTHLDAAYPTYALGRATSAPGQRLAARLKASLGDSVGDGSERAWAIVKPAFEGQNPRAIEEARSAFIKSGREDEWNAGTRAYLQHQWDKAAESLEGINPAMLRRQIFSKPDARAALEAAMGPGQFQGFDNFMQIAEAAARAKNMNSLTAPRQAGAASLAQTAANTPGGVAARGAAAVLNPMQWVGVLAKPFEKISSVLQGREKGRIAERLFSPAGMDYLRKMGTMTVGSQKAIAATVEFLGQTGARVGAASLRDPPENELTAATP